MIWIVIWVVMMMFWLFGVGGYYMSYAPDRPALIGTVIVPWLCVLILGLVLFGAVSMGSGTPGRMP